MIYLGIDIGKEGGIAILDGDMHIAARFNKELYRTVITTAGKGQAACVIEKVGSRPQQGVRSMFSFGEKYGWIQGVLDANGVPYAAVTPQTWKKALGVTADKQTSIDRCKELFPEVNLVPHGCRVEQDGMAEALLLAYYAREFEQWKMT